MKQFDAIRRILNPWLRHLLRLEVTRIMAHDGKWIGLGIRLWQE